MGLFNKMYTETINLADLLGKLPQADAFVNGSRHFAEYLESANSFFKGTVSESDVLHLRGENKVILKRTRDGFSLYYYNSGKNGDGPKTEVYCDFRKGKCINARVFGSLTSGDESPLFFLFRTPGNVLSAFLYDVLSEADYQNLDERLKALPPRTQAEMLDVFPLIYQESFRAQNSHLF